MDKVHHGRKCLVLDLDETLLHSSFKVSRTLSDLGASAWLNQPSDAPHC